MKQVQACLFFPAIMPLYDDDEYELLFLVVFLFIFCTWINIADTTFLFGIVGVRKKTTEMVLLRQQ
jgi:hypothetical protein